MNKNNRNAIFFAILAAALYALSSPIAKTLLKEVPATMMASFLYLGAGVGLIIVSMICKDQQNMKENKLTKTDIPYTVAMVGFDIAAPILLMFGLKLTTAANVSLLNNFEIVTTSVIAWLVFKEHISKQLWVGIGLVTIASIILSIEDMSSFSFSIGSIFVLLACLCWGIENNCTRKLSTKNPIQIVIIKGLGSGTGSLVIALILGESVTKIEYVLVALLLGFVSYGLSIVFYIYAQRYLGAAKTSAYYAVSPFIGTALSLLIYREMPTIFFVIALIIMAFGTYCVSRNE